MNQNLFNMKDLRFYLLSIFALLCCISVNAKNYDFEVNGIGYTIHSLDKRTVYVSKIVTEGNAVITESVQYKNTEFIVDSIGNLYDSYKSESITFPKNLNVESDVLYACGTKRFYVDEKNPYLKAVDGVLYSKDGSELIYYPDEKPDVSFVIPDNVIKLRNYCFGAIHFLERLEMNNNIEILPEETFYSLGYGGKLSYLKLSDKIKKIPPRCLYNASCLKEIILPESLEEFEMESGWGYRGLPGSIESITIKKSNIANYSYKQAPDVFVFSECQNLKKLYVLDENPVELIHGAFSDGQFFNTTLYVPKGKINLYKSLKNWDRFFEIKEVKADEKNMILSVTCGKGGSVSFKDIVATNGSQLVEVVKGEQVTMTITPDKGYGIDYVKVDGVDVTSDLKDNTYTVTMNSNVNVEVMFAELPIYLTIQHADNGNIEMETEKGKTHYFKINSAEGWKINTVTFNGTDVTTQLDENNGFTTPVITEDAILNVSFESLDNAITDVLSDNISVRGYNGNIFVEGIDNGGIINVYTIDGSLVGSKKANGNCVQIAVDANNIYIIKVGERTFKLNL